MFKITLTIALSAFGLMSSAANLFAMEPEPFYDDKDKALISIHQIPEDSMKLIFIEASQGTNPRRFLSVCKPWSRIMHENNVPQVEKLRYSQMTPFMQQCMHTYWEYRYYNGFLQHTPGQGKEPVTFKFSDFKDRTVDLSACGITNKELIITQNIDEFYKVEEGTTLKKCWGSYSAINFNKSLKICQTILFHGF